MDNSQYLVIGYGESDEPDMVIVKGRDGVREGIARMIWGDPKDADPEELDHHMAGFDDEDEWSWGGWRYQIKFEIGGIEITRLNLDQPNGAGDAFQSLFVEQVRKWEILGTNLQVGADKNATPYQEGYAAGHENLMRLVRALLAASPSTAGTGESENG